MPDEQVTLIVSVMTEGVESLKQVDEGMTKLATTTQKGQLATRNAALTNQDYNTSLVKYIPQLKAINPLMTELNLNSIITTGAIGLLSLGFLKVGQSIMDTRANVVDLGVALGQYTSGPAKSFERVQEDVTTLATKMRSTNSQVTASLQVLIQATHDYGEAVTLLETANKVSLATNKSLVDVAKELAKARAQGTMIGGVAVPPGMEAAQREADLMLTQSSKGSGVMANIGRFFSRLFDPTSTDFILKAQPATPHRAGTMSGASGLLPVIPSAPLTINIDGQKVANAVIEIIDGQIRVRGGY